jgi:hypothetical protein
LIFKETDRETAKDRRDRKGRDGERDTERMKTERK